MTALPPDRLRAMARVLDPVAWKTVAEWRLETPSDHYAQLAFEVHAERRTESLAAAQACWEASPGGHHPDILHMAEQANEAAILFPDITQILDVVSREWAAEGQWSPWDQSVRDRITAWLRAYYAKHTSPKDAREALRQALPQGTET